MLLLENNTSNEVWLLYMKKQKRMVASSESSALMMRDIDFRLLARRQFQSKSINSFNEMKDKWKVLLFGSGQSSWVQ
jgi:hypothetical protein